MVLLSHMGANPFVFIPGALRKLLWEIIYFPLHWYGAGLLAFLKSWTNIITNWLRSLGFAVWFSNLFTPMYGQRDFAGRLISFVMRLVQIIFRGLASALVLFLYIIVIIIYLILLPGIILDFIIWL